MNSSLSSISSPDYPHPGLLNAVYLWAIRLSADDLPVNLEIENAYLQRADRYLQVKMGQQLQHHAIQAIEAEVFSSMYNFVMYRYQAGNCHANAAVTLAKYHGLDCIQPDNFSVDDPIETGEKIRLFWWVFAIDHAWR